MLEAIATLRAMQDKKVLIAMASNAAADAVIAKFAGSEFLVIRLLSSGVSERALNIQLNLKPRRVFRAPEVEVV